MIGVHAQHRALSGFLDILESETEAREVFTQAIGVVAALFPQSRNRKQGSTRRACRGLLTAGMKNSGKLCCVKAIEASSSLCTQHFFNDQIHLAIVTRAAPKRIQPSDFIINDVSRDAPMRRKGRHAGNRSRQVAKVGTPDSLRAGCESKIALACFLVESNIFTFSFQIAPELKVEIGLYVLPALAQGLSSWKVQRFRRA